MTERLVFIDPAVKQEMDRVIAEIRAGVVAIFHALLAAKGSDTAMEKFERYLSDRGLMEQDRETS